MPVRRRNLIHPKYESMEASGLAQGHMKNFGPTAEEPKLRF